MNRQSFFGDAAATRAYFTVMAETRGGGPLADWGPSVIAHTHVIPYAFPPRTEVEIVAFGASEVTWRLHLPSAEDFTRLRARLGATDTLYVVHGVLASADRTVQEGTVLYDVLPDTTLLGLDQVSRFRSGLVQVFATFQRTIDPATGKAVPS